MNTDNKTLDADGQPAPGFEDALPTESPVPGQWKVGSLTYNRSGLARLFAWLLWGDFGWQLRDRAVGPVASLLLKQLNASDTAVGVLVGSLPSALAMFMGPIFSTLSDRHRGRLGRRIPFLIAPTPFVVLSLIGLAYVPYLGPHLHAALGPHSPTPLHMSLYVFAVCWVMFEVSIITNGNIFYGLINDVVPHELIGRAFGVFRAVSLLAAIIFNLKVIGLFDDKQHLDLYFRVIFLSLAAIYAVGITSMCFQVKEGQYPPPPPRDPGARSNPFVPIIAYFRETFAMPYYRWIYVALTLAGLAAGPINTFSIFYAKSMHMDLKAYGLFLVTTYIISGCLAFPLGWLADRFHPIRLVMASVGLYAIAMLAGGVLARTPHSFGIAFVLHGVLSGCFLTTVVPLQQLLFPKARFGEFLSAGNVLVGLAYTVLPIAVGRALDLSGHQYRLTFYMSGTIAAIAFMCLMVVYRNFQARGGQRAYIAPE